MVRPLDTSTSTNERRVRTAGGAGWRPIGCRLLGGRAAVRAKSIAAMVAGIGLALGLALGLATHPAAAADDNASGGEKLIGTFTTRAVPAKPGAGSERRGYLTGALATSHSADDSFRREAGDRVFFAAGSAEISSRGRVVLAAQAEWLKRHSELRLTVEGHADDGGNAERNTALSVERANAVRDRLLAEGVEPRRVVVVARGREDRVAVCADPACMAQNRRTVTVVHTTGAGERIGLDQPRPADTDPGRKTAVPR